nr:hypothetical protein [Tanacetum cinerariifolium]
MEKLEIEVPSDLKVLPRKLEEFQSSISIFTSKVDTLKNIKLDIPVGLLALPEKVSSINAKLTKLKVLDAIPSLLNIVAEALDSPPKTTLQTKGERVRDKGKKAISHKEVTKKESDSDSDVDSRPSGTLEESSKHNPLKKFAYINEKGETFQITE